MKKNGFTLIETMIMIAIIGILSIASIFVYQNYLIRSRVMEGLGLAISAKAKISTDATSNISLQSTINEWNSGSSGKGMTSKYVESILLKDNAEIEIKYKSDSIGLSIKSNTLILSPWIRTDDEQTIPLHQAINNGITGSIDWSCSSASKNQAIANGMNPRLGTLHPEYAPASCR